MVSELSSKKVFTLSLFIFPFLLFVADYLSLHVWLEATNEEVTSNLMT